MSVIARRGLERMKLGVWDDGTIAGVYMQEAKVGERPDLTVVEYVRADIYQGAVSDLQRIAVACDNGSDATNTAEFIRRIAAPYLHHAGGR